MRQFWSHIPVGGTLPHDVWLQRHKFLKWLTWFHAAVIASAGVILGYSWEMSFAALVRNGAVLHTLLEGSIVGACAALSQWRRRGRSASATFIGFGLISSSAILVHLSGGYIELHFHFFVMIVFLALYQDWGPFGLAILYVAVHHGVVGVMWPDDVYNHPAAISAPWIWAGIHASFVLWASVGSVIAWRFNETAFAWTQRILNSAGEGIFGLDLNGNVTFMNPSAAETLRIGWRVAIGMSLDGILRRTAQSGSRRFSLPSSPARKLAARPRCFSGATKAVFQWILSARRSSSVAKSPAQS